MLDKIPICAVHGNVEIVFRMFFPHPLILHPSAQCASVHGRPQIRCETFDVFSGLAVAA